LALQDVRSGNKAIQIWHLILEPPLLVQNSRSAKRQYRLSARFQLMHRSKQLRSFDQIVGAGEQKMRDRDLAELTRREDQISRRQRAP
jgi:hypothetical protein